MKKLFKQFHANPKTVMQYSIKCNCGCGCASKCLCYCSDSGLYLVIKNNNYGNQASHLMTFTSAETNERANA